MRIGALAHIYMLCRPLSGLGELTTYLAGLPFCHRLKVVGMSTANLLAIRSIVALCDGLLHWILKYLGASHVTVAQIFGWIFYPIAFLLGVPKKELFLVGQLIGIKTVQN